MRDQCEFFAADDLPWHPDPDASGLPGPPGPPGLPGLPGLPGIEQRILSRADDGITLTRLARWRPGLDTSAGGTIRHTFHEEVYLLTGELTDLTLGRTFGPGHYASRRPGMPHGPYRTTSGCTMLEIRTPG